MSVADEPRTLVVDGRSLELAVHQRPGALRPLVLLHEGLGSVAMWRDFPARLADATGRTAVVYSRSGHGGSDALREPRDPGYMHHEARVVLPALLDALALESAVLFGHSDGASIALIFAAWFPERTGALVLEAPHVFVEPLTLASIAAVKNGYAAGDLRAKLARYHADPDATFRGWSDIWLDPRFAGWSIAAEVARVTAPALLLQGTGDEYGSAAQLEPIARRAAATETVLLERCGHSPHRDRVEVVLARSSAFLAGLP